MSVGYNVDQAAGHDNYLAHSDAVQEGFHLGGGQGLFFQFFPGDVLGHFQFVPQFAVHLDDHGNGIFLQQGFLPFRPAFLAKLRLGQSREGCLQAAVYFFRKVGGKGIQQPQQDAGSR